MTHLNEQRPIRRLGATRRQLLEAVDRPSLRSLPAEPYEFSEWRTCRVWTCPAFVESVFDFTLPALRTEAG
jgi:hypothetical protein